MSILDKWQCTICGGYFKLAGYPHHRKSCPGKPFSRQVAKLRRLKAKRAKTNSST